MAFLFEHSLVIRYNICMHVYIIMCSFNIFVLRFSSFDRSFVDKCV